MSWRTTWEHMPLWRIYDLCVEDKLVFGGDIGNRQHGVRESLRNRQSAKNFTEMYAAEWEDKEIRGYYNICLIVKLPKKRVLSLCKKTGGGSDYCPSPHIWVREI